MRIARPSCETRLAGSPTDASLQHPAGAGRAVTTTLLASAKVAVSRNENGPADPGPFEEYVAEETRDHGPV